MRRGALACPECGADHNSGWKEDAQIYDALHLPEAGFDYKQFAAEEFGALSKPRAVNRFWWITGIFLIAALGLIYFCALR
ncbi:MAG: hypothetical protein M3Z64_01110 [Verrucomicrobiota bacterium]|nr:hypothetical protein [Verrucomicrobiota bacterium]